MNRNVARISTPGWWHVFLRSMVAAIVLAGYAGFPHAVIAGDAGPQTDPIVVHGPRDQKRVALTFDACSTRKHGKYDRRITDILVATRTPATIFLGGKWMEEHPEAAAELSGNPLFELGNHSYTHPHLLRLTDSAVKNELLAAERVLEQLTGKRTSIFRAPFGEVDERVSRIAAECGMLTVQYDLASGDPDTNATAEKLIEYVIRRARNGSIIVMHINGRGWHTAEALPEIVSRLKARGFVFVTVSELIGRHSALTR